MQLDYDQLAKKFFEQFAGSLVVLTLLVFVNEYLVREGFAHAVTFVPDVQ